MNGSNDEIFLDDIKKASESKERERDEDAEMNDGEQQGRTWMRKKHVGEFVDIAINYRDRFRVLGNKTGAMHYFCDVELSNEKRIEIELDS
ncbi:hypothetical protein RFI_22911 [Reticulomyxa filosa]|uniref:Uncharacterized protein n=1 Tax=Reticulomyxa filosa TaxID=46433 RepID=X6MM01_RETFI|nr:hypothetical protein RFI_22911 [Reticulomyxa filosa]|eukprot:ETO14457.1 hypothetical protein RFI_22911 [Reticulomyxa filosa]